MCLTNYETFNLNLFKNFFKPLYYYLIKIFKIKLKIFNGGYLGSHIDEERSQMRYAMRIAEFRESSDLWTQMALG